MKWHLLKTVYYHQIILLLNCIYHIMFLCIHQFHANDHNITYMWFRKFHNDLASSHAYLLDRLFYIILIFHLKVRSIYTALPLLIKFLLYHKQDSLQSCYLDQYLKACGEIFLFDYPTPHSPSANYGNNRLRKTLLPPKAYHNQGLNIFYSLLYISLMPY